MPLPPVLSSLFAALLDVPADGLSLMAALAAVLAGFTSSIHCFAMCGPLACAGCGKSAEGSGRERLLPMASYQLTRVAGYALVGGLLGLLGGGTMTAFSMTPRWLPWAVAAVLVVSALGLGERVPAIPGVAQALRRLTPWSAKLSPALRSGVLGALTPLLPCGLLYGLYASTLVAGSFSGGALLAGGFALGGVPALVLAQLQTRWAKALPRGSEFVLRRVVPLVAAGIVVFRALTVDQGGCPMCH